jgi:SPP1 gp7 family putative phage head morphogenesis protein
VPLLAPVRRPTYPSLLEGRYERDLLQRAAIVHRATMLALRAALVDEVASPAPSMTQWSALERVEVAALEARADALRDLGLVLRILEGVRAVFRDTFAPRPGDVSPIGTQVDLFGTDQLRRALDVPRVAIAADPGALAVWVADNVGLISTIDQRYFADVEDVITKGYRAGTSTKTITAELSDRYGVSQSRAKFIARDQVAKLNGKLTETKQTKLGIREYTWSTSHDERVRPDHRALDRRVFQWTDPPVVNRKTGQRANPGGDYQCRCVAIPVLPEWARKAIAR